MNTSTLKVRKCKLADKPLAQSHTIKDGIGNESWPFHCCQLASPKRGAKTANALRLLVLPAWT